MAGAQGIFIIVVVVTNIFILLLELNGAIVLGTQQAGEGLGEQGLLGDDMLNVQLFNFMLDFLRLLLLVLPDAILAILVEHHTTVIIIILVNFFIHFGPQMADLTTIDLSLCLFEPMAGVFVHMRSAIARLPVTIVRAALIHEAFVFHFKKIGCVLLHISWRLLPGHRFLVVRLFE